MGRSDFFVSMTILDFDQLNKYTDLKARLLSMPPSEIMEKKEEIRDEVWGLLEYAYMLGYSLASTEMGVIADWFIPFLPDDYMDAQPNAEVKLNEEQKDETIYKQIDGKDFSQRVMEHAEKGDAQSIIRVMETDGNRVYNTAGNLGAKASGATSKTWNTMMDERVRDTHDPLEGVTVPIDGKFVTWDGDEADAPCGFTRPENSINCRCWLTFE